MGWVMGQVGPTAWLSPTNLWPGPTTSTGARRRCGASSHPGTRHRAGGRAGGVVIQAVGGGLSLVVALAVVASPRSLLVALADNLKLLAGQLHNFFQRLFE
jgi:hypothetical protein